MMRLMTLCLLAVLSHPLLAMTKGFGLGLESRYELKVNGQEFEGQTWPALSFHLRQNSWAFVADFAGTEQESRVGNLEINNRQIELMPWLRYELTTASRFIPFAGVGLGARQTEVISRIGPLENRSGSDLEWQAGATVGALLTSLDQALFGEIAFKYLYAETDLDPAWALALRLGIQLK